MSTYTPSLGLELITPGSQAGLWGNTTNNTFNLIDQAVTGVTPVSFASASGTTYTLTDFNGSEDEARSAVLNITGTASGSNTVVIPNKQKTYLVRNNTGQDVLFKTAGSGATYTVGAAYSILVFCDGNNNVYTGIQSPSTGTLAVNGGGTGQSTFTAGFVKSPGGTTSFTTSATVNAATELSGVAPVANGGTGQSTLTSGAILTGNGTGAVGTVVGTSSGQVATWNGSQWVAAAPSAAGVTSFNTRTGAVVLTAADLVAAGMQASASSSGYQKFPSGLIMQWGSATSSGTSSFNWTAYFPITFPNALLWGMAEPSAQAVVGTIGLGIASSTTSYLTGTLYQEFSGTFVPTSGVTGRYIAIGY